MNGKVSIVVTLYNYKRYIGDLIESVIAQTYKNWELIIVDDGSTDNPLEVILPYKENRYCISQFRIYRLFGNFGYAYAKNYGIVHTDPASEYIVMIDADDMLTERSVEIRKNLLDQNPDRLWCHGEVYVKDEGVAMKVGEHPRSLRSIKWKKRFRKELEADGIDLTKTYHHRLIHAQSVMVRPALHRKYGLYDESLRFSADNEMWRRIIRFGEVPAYTEEVVAIYRIHPDRMATSEYKRKRMVEVKRRLIEDVERRYKEGINDRNTKLWI